MTRRLFSCHGVVRSGLPDGLVFLFCHSDVRSGLPDGLVFWFCHGDVRSVYRRIKDGYMVRYIVGLFGMVHRWCIGYGSSLVYMVWYLVDFFFFMVRCIVGF